MKTRFRALRNFLRPPGVDVVVGDVLELDDEEAALFVSMAGTIEPVDARDRQRVVCAEPRERGIPLRTRTAQYCASGWIQNAMRDGGRGVHSEPKSARTAAEECAHGAGASLHSAARRLPMLRFS